MKSQSFGNQIIKLGSVDSTNNYTAKLVNQSKISFGTVIMADFQTKGKGQRSLFWNSDKGLNLLFSIYIDTSFLKPDNIFYLSKSVALGLRQCVGNIIGKEVLIKWPNDIQVNKKKIAGVLIENQWKSNNVSSSIIGIGLNVNQSNFPLENKASSLFNITSKKYNIDSIVRLLCSSLHTSINELRLGKLNEIDKDYHDFLFNLNKWALYEYEKIEFKGKIIKVDDNGLLNLELKNGDIKKYKLKQIKLVL
tara:strand:+ start:59 stop:808 length:750 start_codon:yes stop_codon:yes gene_type:complete